jgi:hypothetical protein
MTASMHGRGAQLLFDVYAAALGAWGRIFTDLMHGSEFIFARLTLVIVGGHVFGFRSKGFNHRQQDDGE